MGIKKAGDADPALAKRSMTKVYPWLNDLEKAWHIYNIVTKKEDRNIDGFVGVLPAAAKYIKGGSTAKRKEETVEVPTHDSSTKSNNVNEGGGAGKRKKKVKKHALK